MSVVMEVCRTCMTANQKKRPGKLVSIFAEFEGAVIANIITDCTAVQIAENDGLPVVICYECFETLKLLTAFKITARNSDSKLRMICKEESVESYDKAYIAAQVEVLYGESQHQCASFSYVLLSSLHNSFPNFETVYFVFIV
ncbi:uncharacterized protein LOC134222759 [Armigeres subalbatus]|uniref:uncharacterized protein LOC134222759 n=1 Tax=Armigeres subalbatus TaxID=124917 RepID=UPI002ED0A587